MSTARPVRRQRAAPAVAGGAAEMGAGVGGPSTTTTNSNVGTLNEDLTSPVAFGGGGVGGIINNINISTATSGGGGTFSNNPTLSNLVTALGNDGLKFASLVSAVHPAKNTISNTINSAGPSSQQQQQQFNVYFNVPSTQTPVDEIVNARLLQNAPKVLAAFAGYYSASAYGNADAEFAAVAAMGGSSSQQNSKTAKDANHNTTDTEAVKVYHSTPASALASGFLESPTFGGGPLAPAETGHSAASSTNNASSQNQDTLSRALAAVNNKLLHSVGLLSSGAQMTKSEIAAENERWVRAQQGRVKTTQGVLIMNLRIGCDPPDVERIEPCAKLECWSDPKTMQAKYVNRGADRITDILESQYKSLHKDILCRRVVEGGMEEAKAAMIAARKKAKKDGRVLIHYNGHGTPKATAYGEIWFTGKDHFYPFSIHDMCAAVESPAIYVFDCNSAGSILSTWRVNGLAGLNPNDILLCACSDGEILPMNSLLPADLLTSCLTTPLTVALEWYINYSNRLLLLPNVTPEMVRHLPGDANNRRTPLGELNVILGSILDSVAWGTMSREQYYPVLRNDQLVRNLFRNFFLADKLMREVGCSPVSHPPIPESAHSHHLWETWDFTLESVLAQLPDMLHPDLTVRQGYNYTPTRYFADQLNAFEVWVAIDDKSKAPEQLPTLMLCLSHTTHRVRALLLLCRYLNTGPTAVHSALYCGLGNLITRFLGHTELRLVLIVVWLQITRVDPNWACAELVRIGAEQFFIRFMQSKGNKFKLLSGHETAAAEAAAAAAAATVAPSASTVIHSPTGGASPQPLATPSQPAAYVPMSSSASNTNARLPASASLAAVDGLGDSASGNSPTHNSNSANNNNLLSGGSGGNANTAELPSFCALEGMTMERCRAISCYMLCRMIDVQQQQQQQNTTTSNTANSLTPVSSYGQANNNNNTMSNVAAPPPTSPAAIQVWNNMGVSAGIGLLNTSETVEVKSWAALFLSKLIDSLRCAKEVILKELSKRRDLFYPLMDHPAPPVRASCVTLLGSLLGSRIDNIKEPADQDRRVELDKNILQVLSQHISDPSRNVRIELTVAAAQIVATYYPLVKLSRSQGVLPNSFFGAGDTQAHSPNSNHSGDNNGGHGGNSYQSQGSSFNDGNSGGGAVRSGRNIFGSNAALDSMAGSNTNNPNNNNNASSQSAKNFNNTHGVGSFISEDLGLMNKRSLMIPESDIGVASALSKNTASSAAAAENDRNAFATQLITKDDPPIIGPWNLRALSKYQIQTIEALVHDALVIIARMQCGCDNGVARRAAEVFSELSVGGRPTSDRITREANLTMNGISSDATPTLTETDRVRERRNADLMRQVVLDLRPSQVFVPAVMSNNNSSATGGGSGHNVQTPAGSESPMFPSPVTSRPPGAVTPNSFATSGNYDAADGPRPHHNIQHLLPIAGHDAIISAQFRVLEPHVVTVERSNRISIVSYEDTNRIQVLESFQHSRREPIISGLLINDLAESPAFMVVDRAGVFTFYNNLLTGKPSVVSAFNSATGAKAGRNLPPSTLLGNEVICSYRPLDSMLFYGCGNGGIQVLSVADEQLVQSIETPGEGAVSSIFTQGHGGRIVIAGFTDGIIRNYDDRGKGTTSLFNSWETKPSATRTAYDAVVGVGFAGDSSVYAATRNSLMLFDVRQTQRALKVVDVIPTMTSGKGPVASALTLGSQSTSKQFVSSFSMCSHFGLMATMTTEGVCDVYNQRLESLLVCGLPVNQSHTYYNTVIANAQNNNSGNATSALGGGGSSSSILNTAGGSQQSQGPMASAQRAQETIIAGSSTLVAYNSPTYRPLRIRSDNTIINTTFHPMKPMVIFGNELVTLYQTHSAR